MRPDNVCLAPLSTSRQRVYLGSIKMIIKDEVIIGLLMATYFARLITGCSHEIANILFTLIKNTCDSVRQNLPIGFRPAKNDLKNWKV